MSFVKSNGNDIYFEHTESKNGKHIFAIPGHASGINISRKMRVIQEMATQKGFGFTCFDFAGYGKSSGEPKKWQLEECLQNTLDVYDAIGTKDNFILGHSMGGFLMLAFAILRPEKIKGLVGLMAGFGKSFVENRKDRPFVEDIASTVRIEIGHSENPFYTFVDKKIDINLPTFLLTSLGDETVNYRSSISIASSLAARDAEVMILKEAPHSISEPRDLQHMFDFMDRV